MAKDYAETGFVAAGASFVTVGTNGCYLTQIQPNIAKSNGEIQIQLLNKNGVDTATYKYYKGGRGDYKTDGWYAVKTLITTDNDVFFPAGSGLWMYGKDGASFTTSGEVLTSDLTVALNDGFQMLANPFPVAITLTKIVPDIAKSNGDIQIQLLNKNGVDTATYKYYKGGRGDYKTDGWYAVKTLITEENDIEFAAGDGIWLYGKAGSNVTFTCPIQ